MSYAKLCVFARDASFLCAVVMLLAIHRVRPAYAGSNAINLMCTLDQRLVDGSVDTQHVTVLPGLNPDHGTMIMQEFLNGTKNGDPKSIGVTITPARIFYAGGGPFAYHYDLNRVTGVLKMAAQGYETYTYNCEVAPLPQTKF